MTRPYMHMVKKKERKKNVRHYKKLCNGNAISCRPRPGNPLCMLTIKTLPSLRASEDMTGFPSCKDLRQPLLKKS
jgi:hypothetical protein